MKPTVDKLAEDLEKTKRELLKLSEDKEKIDQELLKFERQLVDIQSSKILPLGEQISNIKAKLLYAATVGTGVAIVLAAFGLTAWFWKLPKMTDEMISSLPQKISVILKPEVEKQVGAARTEIIANLNDKMEDVIYASGDFQKALDEYRDGDMKLVDLHEIVENRLKNEIIVSLYTDILLRDQEYVSAMELLRQLKDNHIFPKPNNRYELYCQAGSIQLIMSLNEQSQARARQISDARRWLEEAVKKGQERRSRKDMRRPLEWLVFLHLSQGEERLAAERAQQYKDLGGKPTNLSSHTGKKLFCDLKKEGPLINQGLERILARVFSETKSAADSER